jgi:hypothetical protein
MKTLTIKDLARTEDLGRTAMAAVRGGMGKSMQQWYPSDYMPKTDYSPKSDSSIHATQDLMQVQKVINSTANGSAFLSGVSATNTTDQFGQNNIAVL